jgi:hypothetical protein
MAAGAEFYRLLPQQPIQFNPPARQPFTFPTQDHFS